MCGIDAITCAQPVDNFVTAEIHGALYLLQHRGQGNADAYCAQANTESRTDACGIATCGSGGKIYQCKGNVLAATVFKTALEYRTCADRWWAFDFDCFEVFSC